MTKLAVGVLMGLLLSAPAIIPFIEFCQYSYLSNHTYATGFAGLRPEALPQVFFPWLFGGIWSYSNDSQILSTIWGSVGGYLSAAQMAVVMFGLLITRRRGLYLVLLTWILVCFTRTFALPFISSLVDIVPLIKLVAFCRYAPQSCEFCSAVLCAVVVTDIYTTGAGSRRKIIVALAMALFLSTISLYPASKLLLNLYPQEGFRVFFCASLIWGIGTIILVSVFLIAFKSNHLLSGRAVAILLAIDAIALFSLPMLYGENGPVHSAGIDYLEKKLVTDRFYTLGPIPPNYGAYYRIASINHNYLPVATNWVRYIQRNLDPYADAVNFTGNAPRSNPDAPTQMEVLRENVAAYEKVGVRYIVSPHSVDPFERSFSLVLLDHNNQPFSLGDGQSVTGRISGRQFLGAQVNEVGILIGTYFDSSDGVLKIRLCADGSCAEGERNLREAQDNKSFRITLDRPITLGSGNIEYEISHVEGSHPVALWIYPLSGQQQSHDSDSIPAGYSPSLKFIQMPAPGEKQPRCVFESSEMDIYELPNTRPYFDLVEGDGTLRIENRSVVSVTCRSESELVRRELYCPGWKAFIDGKQIHIGPYDNIFQAMRVPAGQHKITFSYSPTHSRSITVLFLSGVLLFLLGLARISHRSGDLRTFRPLSPVASG